jgi:hypothetical protein
MICFGRTRRVLDIRETRLESLVYRQRKHACPGALGTGAWIRVLQGDGPRKEGCESMSWCEVETRMIVVALWRCCLRRYAIGIDRQGVSAQLCLVDLWHSDTSGLAAHAATCRNPVCVVRFFVPMDSPRCKARVPASPKLHLFLGDQSCRSHRLPRTVGWWF